MYQDTKEEDSQDTARGNQKTKGGKKRVLAVLDEDAGCEADQQAENASENATFITEMKHFLESLKSIHPEHPHIKAYEFICLQAAKHNYRNYSGIGIGYWYQFGYQAMVSRIR